MLGNYLLVTVHNNNLSEDMTARMIYWVITQLVISSERKKLKTKNGLQMILIQVTVKQH